MRSSSSVEESVCQSLGLWAVLKSSAYSDSAFCHWVEENLKFKEPKELFV